MKPPRHSHHRPSSLHNTLPFATISSSSSSSSSPSSSSSGFLFFNHHRQPSPSSSPNSSSIDLNYLISYSILDFFFCPSHPLALLQPTRSLAPPFPSPFHRPEISWGSTSHCSCISPPVSWISVLFWFSHCCLCKCLLFLDAPPISHS